MELVIEMHRAIQIGDLIEQDFVGGLLKRVTRSFLMCLRERRARFEAHILGGWILAGMALQAVKFRQILLHGLSGHQSGSDQTGERNCYIQGLHFNPPFPR